MTKEGTSYQIVWRPMAEADIDNIIDYIAQDHVTKAKEFAQELREKTLLLTQHPNSGRTGRPGLPSFVRELVVHRNYIVFYRILNTTHTIEILRVKHAAQQMP